MFYVSPNFKTKKALKEAVARGDAVRVFAPGLGTNAPSDDEFKLVLRFMDRFPSGWRCHGGVAWEAFPEYLMNKKTQRELLLNKVAAGLGFDGHECSRSNRAGRSSDGHGHWPCGRRLTENGRRTNRNAPGLKHLRMLLNVQCFAGNRGFRTARVIFNMTKRSATENSTSCRKQ